MAQVCGLLPQMLDQLLNFPEESSQTARRAQQCHTKTNSPHFPWDQHFLHSDTGAPLSLTYTSYDDIITLRTLLVPSILH